MKKKYKRIGLPEPYYQTELGTLYCGDCLEIMPYLPKVDLILTDPPYGIGESNEKNASRKGKACIAMPTDFGHYDWDKEKIDPEILVLIKKISTNQIIFGGNYYGSVLGDTSCYLVWDKDNGKSDFADCELAWTSFNTAVRKFTWKWSGMLQQDMKHKEKRYHPTQKPIGLFHQILEKYSDSDMVILDPMLGSGTTAIVCERLNRRWVGIEQIKEYCEIAKQRLEKEVIVHERGKAIKGILARNNKSK